MLSRWTEGQEETMSVRVVVLSDTHNCHWKLPKLPDGDVLVHAGDFTFRGNQQEILDFNDWLGRQDHPYKLVVPGNHEVGFQDAWHMCCALLSNADHVLKDQGCEVMGKKFWGSPWTPEFMGWAFGYSKREGEMRWEMIPEGLDMLITHGPPHMVFDTCYDKEQKMQKNVGCKPLFRQVMERAKPRFHVFGHVHESYGRATFQGVYCMNASQLDGNYRQQPDRTPMVVDL